mgnify:CR=1 FL=1
MENKPHSLFLCYFISYLCVIKRTLNAMDKPMNRIKEVLEEKGIKQTWLAEKLGKSFSIVNSYVCNRRQPSLETLFQIAEILNVETVNLLTSQQGNKKNM